MRYLDLLVQGVVEGSIYALVAIGLTLVYGLLRILHIAHAGIFTLGAYVGLLLTNETGSFAAAFVITVVAVGFFGMAFYRIFYEPILDKPPHVALIASIGLFVAMEEVFRMVFGPTSISFLAPPLKDTVEVVGVRLEEGRVVVVVLAVGLIAGLAVLAGRTRIGLAWRATVSDAAMAESFGVDLARVRYVNFFVASALAAAAGVMVALLLNQVIPTMGGVPAYKALAIIVLGGLGNVKGTLIAALALGVIESFGAIYLDDVLDRDAIAFAFLIAVLMIRPQGLFIRR